MFDTARFRKCWCSSFRRANSLAGRDVGSFDHRDFGVVRVVGFFVTVMIIHSREVRARANITDSIHIFRVRIVMSDMQVVIWVAVVYVRFRFVYHRIVEIHVSL